MPVRDDAVYLAEIVDAIDLARRFVADMDKLEFLADIKTQSAVVRQLEIVGEACGRISATCRADHPEIPWAKPVEIRNILIHRYFGVDPTSSGTRFTTTCPVWPN